MEEAGRKKTNDRLQFLMAKDIFRSLCSSTYLQCYECIVSNAHVVCEAVTQAQALSYLAAVLAKRFDRANLDS